MISPVSALASDYQFVDDFVSRLALLLTQVQRGKNSTTVATQIANVLTAEGVGLPAAATVQGGGGPHSMVGGTVTEELREEGRRLLEKLRAQEGSSEIEGAIQALNNPQDDDDDKTYMAVIESARGLLSKRKLEDRVSPETAEKLQRYREQKQARTQGLSPRGKKREHSPRGPGQGPKREKGTEEGTEEGEEKEDDYFDLGALLKGDLDPELEQQSKFPQGMGDTEYIDELSQLSFYSALRPIVMAYGEQNLDKILLDTDSQDHTFDQLRDTWAAPERAPMNSYTTPDTFISTNGNVDWELDADWPDMIPHLARADVMPPTYMAKVRTKLSLQPGWHPEKFCDTMSTALNTMQEYAGLTESLEAAIHRNYYDIKTARVIEYAAASNALKDLHAMGFPNIRSPLDDLSQDIQEQINEATKKNDRISTRLVELADETSRIQEGLVSHQAYVKAETALRHLLNSGYTIGEGGELSADWTKRPPDKTIFTELVRQLKDDEAHATTQGHAPPARMAFNEAFGLAMAFLARGNNIALGVTNPSVSEPFSLDAIVDEGEGSAEGIVSGEGAGEGFLLGLLREGKGLLEGATARPSTPEQSAAKPDWDTSRMLERQAQQEDKQSKDAAAHRRWLEDQGAAQQPSRLILPPSKLPAGDESSGDEEEPFSLGAGPAKHQLPASHEQRHSLEFDGGGRTRRARARPTRRKTKKRRKRKKAAKRRLRARKRKRSKRKAKYAWQVRTIRRKKKR